MSRATRRMLGSIELRIQELEEGQADLVPVVDEVFFLRGLIISGLSDRERRVYDAISRNPWTTSFELARKMDTSTSNVCNFLKSLLWHGLVERRYNEGGFFEWSVKRPLEE